jgi:hypothetical protein
VLQIKIPLASTALTHCSPCCLGRRFDFAPSLIVLGVAEPDKLRSGGVARLQRGHPLACQGRILGGARSVRGERLITPPIEEQQVLTMLTTQVVACTGLTGFIPRDEGTGGRLMAFQPPAKPSSLAPDIQVLRRGVGSAMALVSAPAPAHRVEGPKLPHGSRPQPSALWPLRAFGFEPLPSFGTWSDQPVRSVVSTTGTLHRKAEEIEALMHRRDGGLLDRACAFSCRR